MQDKLLFSSIPILFRIHWNGNKEQWGKFSESGGGNVIALCDGGGDLPRDEGMLSAVVEEK